MQKHSRSTEFACAVRNYTANAIRLKIPFGTLEAAPKMTSDAHERLVGQNRQRYAVQSPKPEFEPKREPPQSGAIAQRAKHADPEDASTDAAAEW
jgi:hypothetical protein